MIQSNLYYNLSTLLEEGGEEFEGKFLSNVSSHVYFAILAGVYQVPLLAGWVAGLCIKSLKSQLFPLSLCLCSLLSPGRRGRVLANKCSGCICIVPSTKYQHLALTYTPPPPQRERGREEEGL